MMVLVLALLQLTVFARLASADDSSPSDESILELMHLGDYEKSLDQLQKAFSLFPYNESIRNKLAAAYEYTGQRQLKRKLFDEAAGSFDRARELFPDRQEYGIQRGIALYLGKRYDDAAYELERDRHDGGDNAVLLFYLGLIRYDTGNLAEALDAWDKALALDPDNKAIREMAEKARRESPRPAPSSPSPAWRSP